MLGWWTDLQEDELLYSGWARYVAQRQPFRQSDAILELFGKVDSSRTQIGLPSGIASFLERLPPGHSYTADELITRHTIFPYYAAFLSEDDAHHIKVAMCGNLPMSIHNLVGVSSWVGFPKNFRFCPLCVQEVREKLGFCYFRRNDYLPGVEVCTKHKVFLQYSDVLTIPKLVRRGFVSAEEIVLDVEIKPVDPSNRSDVQLMKLAEDAIEVVRQTDYHMTPDVARKKYLYLLAERGLATYRGKPRSPQIVREMKERFSDVLRYFDIDISPDERRNWVVRVLQNRSKTLSPIYHLLMMQFLEVTPASLAALPEAPKYFGDGPWPCLNPKCERFRTLCVREYKLDYAVGGNPRGLFRCPICGYEYSRIGPDASPKDIFKRQPKMADTSSKSQRNADIHLLALHKESIQKLLQSRSGITRTEIYLAIPSACQYVCAYDRQWYEDNMPTPKKPRRQFGKSPEMTAMFHEEIESAFRENPMIKRSEIYKKHYSAFVYLRRYDQEWIYTKLPAPITQKGKSHAGVNWDKRDTDTAAKLPDAAKKLKTNTPDRPPEQATKWKILDAIEAPPSVRNNLKLMPKTSQLFEELAETHLEIALRRLAWACARYREEGKIPTRSQLLTRASLSYLLDWPEIQQALDAALKTFHESESEQEE